VDRQTSAVTLNVEGQIAYHLSEFADFVNYAVAIKTLTWGPNLIYMDTGFFSRMQEMRAK
jgi:hypothetical protein